MCEQTPKRKGGRHCAGTEVGKHGDGPVPRGWQHRAVVSATAARWNHLGSSLNTPMSGPLSFLRGSDLAGLG